MRHFESGSLRLALLLTGLAYGAVACSADSDRGPPIGAPTGPIVVSEGGSISVGVPSGGQGTAGNPGDTTLGGSFNAGGSGGDPFNVGNAGSAVSAAAGSATQPFGSAGSTSSFGGSF